MKYSAHDPVIISSTANNLVKSVVRLHESRERKKTGLFIVEGERAIKTVLKKLKLQTLFCTAEHHALAQQLSKELFLVTEQVMQKMSNFTSPSGLLAVFQIPPQPPLTKLGPGIVLAQISDPGNMGTLMRTAAACDIATVVVIEGSDPWSPKVVQASAGAIANVNIFQIDFITLLRSKTRLRLAALVVEGGQPLSTIDKTKTLLMVGNEARGIPDEWIEQCDSSITLPMPGGTESLNAGVAGSIAIYNTFMQ